MEIMECNDTGYHIEVLKYEKLAMLSMEMLFNYHALCLWGLGFETPPLNHVTPACSDCSTSLRPTPHLPLTRHLQTPSEMPLILCTVGVNHTP
ncbi:hypothetical protein KUCAC02_018139 [Chaenocephalus aceratus]|uniref:Uncharacterized protein n=1 Tax=Chaenocephalus aceratus TaxID=36190 RepID=A0ACB9W7K9_CHAAC|nr:hypothetical protein KUCAC02_018139 [Chaenocephalus aceratus]